MCQAFADAGCRPLLVHPARRTIPTPVGEYYGLRREIARHPGACLDVIGWLPESGWINRRFGPAASALTTATFVLGLFPRLVSIRRQKDTLIYTRDLRIASVISACFPSLRRRLFVECHSLSASARRRAVQLKILKRCAGVVCMTGAMQNRFVEMGVPVDHTMVATDAVDLETFVSGTDRNDARAMLGLDADATIAAFIGRFHTMEMEKGIPGVIEAARYLVPEHPELRFAFIGGPLDRVAAYRAQIESLDLPADRFLFFDKQPVTDIPKWLAAADMLLMPFPWTEHYAYYASPLKMFEYMAGNRPVIATELPVVMEVLQHDRDALLVPPDDAPALASAIERLIGDTVLGERLAAAALAKVQTYSWTARAERILSFMAARAADG